MAIHNDRVSNLTQSRKLVQVSPDPNCHYFLTLPGWQYGDPLWSIHDLPLFVLKKSTPTFINAKDDNVGSNATRIWDDPTFYHLQSKVQVCTIWQRPWHKTTTSGCTAVEMSTTTAATRYSNNLWWQTQQSVSVETSCLLHVTALGLSFNSFKIKDLLFYHPQTKFG